MATAELDIKIVSDIVCPWCVVGSRNLEQALQTLSPDVTAHLSWRPYQLNPHIPPEGQNLREHLQQKYGSSDAELEAMQARITEMGAQSGFRFNFTADMKGFNTFDGHRAMHWAREQGQENAFMKALFVAYFIDHKDPGDHHVLVAIADELGLDGSQLEQALQGDAYREAVSRDIEQAQRLGISSVPTFIINDQYAISGGQPPDAFVDALQQIATESSTT